MITLYYATQSRAIRALWMLEEIGQPYRRVKVDIRAKDHPRPDFLKISPLGKVPAIVDGETSVAESGAVLLYLTERFPEADLAPPPGDPSRGRFLQWLFFAVANIEAGYTQKLQGLELPHSTAGWGSFDHMMEVIERALTPGPWIVGEQFTAVDVLLGVDLYFGQEVMKIVPHTKAIDAYLERCRERPALHRAIAIDSGEVD
jgi:glutathione S-transferase